MPSDSSLRVAHRDGVGGKQLVVADIAYDSEAVLDYLLLWHPVPYYSLKDEMGQLSILSNNHSR
jgi:hypothetical protein